MSLKLNPYPEYKDSGLPWLGEIPAHWNLKRAKYLFREIDDRTDTGQETLLSMRHNRGLVPHNDVSNKEVSDTDLIGYKRTWPGDIVMNRMRASSGLFAETFVHGLVSPDYAVFQPITANVDSEYFVRLFKCPEMGAKFRAESKGLGTGTAGFLRLYSDSFGTLTLPVPSRREQADIVRFLVAHNEQVARFIRAKQQLIELLNEQKQGIIQQAVTRGIDSGAHLRQTGLYWLPEVPAHWRVLRLKRVAANVNEQTSVKRSDEVYVALEHIEGWTGNLTLPETETVFDSQVKRFQAGDVLLGKLRPYLAKVTRLEQGGVCVGELLVLRCWDESILQEYLEQLLRSPMIIDCINSSTFGAKMPRADWDFIGNIHLALPPSREEQKRILQHIGQNKVNIDKVIQRAQREIELMREYRTRLISDVVTGKLDVRDVELPYIEEAENVPSIATENSEPSELLTAEGVGDVNL